MKKGSWVKRKSNKRDNAHYYPPETMPFVICVACLNVVLEHSEKARKLYDKVMECHELTGCQEMLEKLEVVIPKGEELLKRFIERLEDVAKVEQEPKFEGRAMHMILAPSKSKKKK